MKKRSPEDPEIDMTSLNEQAYKECLAMTKYALAAGKKIPPGTVEALQSFARSKSSNVKNLIHLHGKLAQIVAPATPKTILILETESAKKHFFNFLGTLPLVRHLMLVALIFLILFIGSQTFEAADMSLAVLDQSGWIFILLIITLISAAGLGASFAALFQANKYITSGTYDPKYESSYWIRFILGIISGLTLSILVPIPAEWYQKVGSAAAGTNAPVNNLAQMAKPLLAMLGGFSTNVVYRILSRMVETIESLITGTKEEAFAVKEKELNARMAEEDFHTRQEMATGLLDIMQKIEPNTDQQQLKDQLGALLKKVSATGDLDKAGDEEPQSTLEAAVTTEDSTSKEKPAQKNDKDKKDDKDESV